MTCRIVRLTTHLSRANRFSLQQYPRLELKIKKIEKLPYTSVIGNLIYTQVCTHLDIAYIIGMLGRHLNNPGPKYSKVIKRVMMNLQKIKDYMLTYLKSGYQEVIGYLDFNFVGCLDSRRFTSGYVFMFARESIMEKHQIDPCNHFHYRDRIYSLP